MNTRTLMVTSAIIMGVMGLTATFLPHEILAYGGWEAGPAPVLLLQVCSGLLLGFAMLNWMARGNLIGGIYSRPVCIGNLMHFVVGGLALTKGAMAHPAWMTWTLGVLYVLFAISFAMVLFRNPVQGDTQAAG